MTSPVHRAQVDLWTAQLRAAREFRHLSQEAVGARIGVSGQRIWKWEGFHNRPSTDLLVAWAEAVGWDLYMEPTGMRRLTGRLPQLAEVLARAEAEGSAVVSIAAVRRALNLDRSEEE